MFLAAAEQAAIRPAVGFFFGLFFSANESIVKRSLKTIHFIHNLNQQVKAKTMVTTPDPMDPPGPP